MLRDLTFKIVLMSVVAVFVCVGMAEAQFNTDGLVAYWTFDADTIDGKNVEDVLGENDGTIEGNLKEVAGKVSEALEFDGTSFVDIPGTDALNFSGKEEMTVAAWINVRTNIEDGEEPVKGVVDPPGACCGTIVAQRDVNSWALRYDGRNGGQEMEFIVQPGWTGDGGFGIPLPAMGEWHHLAGVVAGNELQLYLDGELVNTLAYGGPMVNAGSETEIGNAGDGGFVGLIDEVMIYDRALDEDEIKDVFEAEGLAVEPGGKLAISWGEIKK